MKRAAFPFALVALIVLQSLFVAGYVTHEHTLYFWDHAMYHNMARALAAAFRAGTAEGLSLLGQSLGQDYNYIFTLPSLLTFALFGDGRLAFILTNFLFYFVAYEVAAAFVLRRVFNLGWPTSLLLGFGLCSLIPALWLPLLEGYPDIGAAACIAFAAGLALKPAGKFRMAVLTGLLLGLAILLRRHFVYAAVALLMTAGAFDFFSAVFRAAPVQRWQRPGRLALYYGLCGGVMAGLVGAVAPDFFIKALTIDYGALYLSYKRPAIVFLRFALSEFGLLLSVAAVSGFFLAAQRIPAARRSLAFIAALTLVWLVLWCCGPSQAGHHYILHFLPLLAVAGLGGLFISLSRRPVTRLSVFAVGLLALALAANSAWALWFSPEGVKPNFPGAPRLLSAPRPPVIRKDYDELARLASTLAATTSPDDRIYVVGSSFVFNQDLLRAVTTDVLHTTEPFFRFLPGPEIDSNHASLPDAFAAATVYVVPEPPQYHLDPSAQKVVTAVAGQFPPPSGRASLFHKDPEVFQLEDGVRVSLWRRDPWIPGALHAALGDIRRTAPLARQDWVALATPRQLLMTTNDRNQTDVTAVFDQARPGLELFFDFPLMPGDYRLGMTSLAQPDCLNPRFDLSVFSAKGGSFGQSSFAPPLTPGPVFQLFTVPPTSLKLAFIQLRLKAEPRGPCAIVLKQLTVERL